VLHKPANMVILSPRIQFFEINDQPWYGLPRTLPLSRLTSNDHRFPQYFREKVQSCLTLAWTFKVPLLQKTSPAQLVASCLYNNLGSSVTKYTYVDFCAGAGGPTPFIEQDLNAKLTASRSQNPNGSKMVNGATPAVKFVLTDIHPHIPDWMEASKKSDNLTFVSKSIDAANAPSDLVDKDEKVFRLFNLAFHHFDDELGSDILKNTLDTADGFGYVIRKPDKAMLTPPCSIFELQERTFSSLITIILLGPLFWLITPYYFWRSPGHLFFTYVIPIIPFVLVADGIVSSLRTRVPGEVDSLLQSCGGNVNGWKIKSGHEMHTWPTGYVTWIIGVKDE
jgi:hypothetical protein